MWERSQVRELARTSTSAGSGLQGEENKKYWVYKVKGGFAWELTEDIVVLL